MREQEGIAMARPGFIHDKLDIKILELYLMDRVVAPIEFNTLSELCMHHEGVDWFELTEATAELVESGHLSIQGERYAITEKGRTVSTACESSLPVSVRRRCVRDLSGVNAALRRIAQIRGETHINADGSVTARMALDDDRGNLLSIQLLCPSQSQADQIVQAFKARPEQIYNDVLEALTCTGEEGETL